MTEKAASPVFRASVRSLSRIECTDERGNTVFATHRQMQVLASLANDERTVREMAYDWPGLSESSVRSMVNALYRKGLVEPNRWTGQSREWCLSRRGSAFLNATDLWGWTPDSLDDDTEPDNTDSPVPP